MCPCRNSVLEDLLAVGVDHVVHTWRQWSLRHDLEFEFGFKGEPESNKLGTPARKHIFLGTRFVVCCFFSRATMSLKKRVWEQQLA